MTATSIFSVISSNLDSSWFIVAITSKFMREQLGHAIKFIPLDLIFKPLKISQPTFISSTGSEASEILSVSPIPSNNKVPKPIADLTVPDLKPPASVIPK